MFKINISPKAKDHLRVITKNLYRRAISEAFDDLRSDPYVGKPLRRELTGKYSYRVATYRIVYVIREKDKTVKILKVQLRPVVYN